MGNLIRSCGLALRDGPVRRRAYARERKLELRTLKFFLATSAILALVGPAAAGTAAKSEVAHGPQFTAWSTPVNLGPTVNSAAVDSGPAISKDRLSLYFYSNRPGGLGNNDIWVSQRASVDDAWGAPVDLGPPVNSAFSDFVPAFSRDGHWLFFASDRPGGHGAQDIWASWRDNIHDDFDWQAPINLGPNVNSTADDNAATYFKHHGNTQLIFGSGRIGGANRSLFLSNLQADGTWGPATPIAELNASGFTQNRPTIRRDGLEIFFYSNRPGGLGQNDLWVATRDSLDATWSTPVDVGATVNTSSTDQHPYLSADAKTLFFSSDRPGGSGGLDLYVTTRSKVHGHAGATPLGQITEFSSGFNPGAIVGSLTPGPDGNLWFADRGTKAIGQITPTGAISEYSSGLPAGSVPGSGSGGGIAFGPDGNIWFTDSGTTKAIGVFNPFTHAISEFSAGLNPGSLPFSVVAGADENVWFIDRGTTKAIGVINPATHAISEFSAGLNAGSLPNILTFGPDGNVWFSDGGTIKAIGRINVTTHVISEFSSGLSSTGVSRPIAGPDGNLWFVDKSPTAPAVGRITPNGVITEFPITLLPGQFLNAANFGPDGGLWIGPQTPGGISRFDLTTHAYTTFSNSLSGQPGVLLPGPDLNIWTTDSGTTPAIARVRTGVCDGFAKGCNLQEVNLQNMALVGANLQGSNLQKAQLENIRLIGAKLQGANMQHANVAGAKLVGASLQGSNLQKADFAGANFTNADLAGANAEGANLTDADLTGANLKGANLHKTSLTAIVWSNTTCPDGSNSDNDGGTCVNNE